MISLWTAAGTFNACMTFSTSVLSSPYPLKTAASTRARASCTWHVASWIARASSRATKQPPISSTWLPVAPDFMHFMHFMPFTMTSCNLASSTEFTTASTSGMLAMTCKSTWSTSPCLASFTCLIQKNTSIELRNATSALGLQGKPSHRMTFTPSSMKHSVPSTSTNFG